MRSFLKPNIYYPKTLQEPKKPKRQFKIKIIQRIVDFCFPKKEQKMFLVNELKPNYSNSFELSEPLERLPIEPSELHIEPTFPSLEEREQQSELTELPIEPTFPSLEEQQLFDSDDDKFFKFLKTLPYHFEEFKEIRDEEHFDPTDFFYETIPSTPNKNEMNKQE